jgi:hypothetical protein
VGDQLLQLVERGLFRSDLDQLDLVELVEANEPADVFTVGARLAAEAGGIGAIVDRKLSAIEKLLPVKVHQRDLGSRDEVKIPLSDLEEILLELG